jgi:hypothetical protein
MGLTDKCLSDVTSHATVHLDIAFLQIFGRMTDDHDNEMKRRLTTDDNRATAGSSKVKISNLNPQITRGPRKEQRDNFSKVVFKMSTINRHISQAVLQHSCPLLYSYSYVKPDGRNNKNNATSLKVVGSIPVN